MSLSRIACFSLLLASLATSRTYAQRGPSSVVASKVVTRELAASQDFVGTVRPTRRAVVGSAVDGRMESLFTKQGDAVKAGQPLAQLRTGTLEIHLAAAAAELKLRQHELAELKNGSRPEELAQALARRKATEALHSYTKSRLGRMRKAFEKDGAVTKEEVEEVISAHVAAEQKLLENTAAHDLAKAGPRIEKIQQAEARVEMQEAEVRRLKDLLLKYTPRAPFDGHIVAEHTEVGAWITSGDIIAEVVELSEVEIEVFVPESDIAHIRRGDEATLEVSAVREKVFTGKVVRIVPQADIESRSFPVLIRLKNTFIDGDPVLKSGMLVKTTLQVGRKIKATLVPKDALVLGGRTPTIFVVNDTPGEDGNSTVRAVTVRLGASDGTLIQVIGDVQEGQSVVVQGNERLRPGQSIKIARTQATP
jgi:RND family efflux transporter MFP subunit